MSRIDTSNQPIPKGKGQPIVELVVSDLEARADLGEKKYGEKLKANNGRDAMIDAYQEAMDLVMYLRQLIEEKVDTKEENPYYPLELTDNLHICLWYKDEGKNWKITIASFQKDKEGYYLVFVGDRPLDSRVNWKHFRKLIRKGQDIAYQRFEQNELSN